MSRLKRVKPEDYDGLALAKIYLSQEEAAVRCGVSVRTIRQRIADGELPAYRFGRGPKGPIRIKITDLEALMRPIPTVRDAR